MHLEIDESLFNRFRVRSDTDFQTVNLDLALYQEQNPFSSFRKNSKKVRALCVLICSYLSACNWDGIKLILLYAYCHTMIIDTVCNSMNEQLADVLGEWIIQTFQNKRDLRSLYTALVRQKRELFFVLKDLSIGYMVKTKDLVHMMDSLNRDSSLKYTKTMILRFGLDNPCISAKIKNSVFMHSCIYDNNHLLLNFIRSHGVDYAQYVCHEYVDRMLDFFVRWDLFNNHDLYSLIWELDRAKVEIINQKLLQAAKAYMKRNFLLFTKTTSEPALPDDIVYTIANFL